MERSSRWFVIIAESGVPGVGPAYDKGGFEVVNSSWGFKYERIGVFFFLC